MLHIPHGTAHIRIPLCTRTMLHHRPWNSLVVYLCWTIGVQWAVDSAIRIEFYKLLSVLVKLYTLRMPLFHIPTFGNHRNNSKTAPISRYLVRHSLGKPMFLWFPRYFKRDKHVTRHYGISSLFHIRTSFVHMTNQFAHQQAVSWAVNGSRIFRDCLTLPTLHKLT